MKKVGVAVVIIFSIILLVFSSGCLEAKEEAGVCSAYDGNQEECIAHEECKWISDKNECDASDIDDIQGDASEGLDVPDTTSNAICKQIPLSSELSPGDKYYCLAVVNNDVSFCENIDDTESKNLCLAIAGNDATYCNSRSSQNLKTQCYNLLAQISGNIDVCDGIDYNSHDEQQCYFNYVNGLYWEDKSNEITTEDCNKVGIDNSDTDKNTCLAFKTRDVSLCGNNKNCLTFFPQEMSFCDGATFKAEDECIRDRAMVNKDISICDAISTQQKIDDCYGDYSSHMQPSTAICDKIIGMMRRQSCYMDVAINLAKN